jgi:hypothetical protein
MTTLKAEHMRRPLLLMAFLLSGCMQTDEQGHAIQLLEQVPIESVTLPGNYAAMANCAYPRLDKASGSGIKKTDLGEEMRLTLEGGGVRYWGLTFRPDGRATRVSFTQAQTMWGPLGAKEVMPIVRSCVS